MEVTPEPIDEQRSISDGSRASRSSFGRLWRLCRKELRETLRDRRTIVTLVLMPILVYPILCIVFQRSLFTSFAPAAQLKPIIGVQSQGLGETLNDALSVGDHILKQQTATPARNQAETAPLENIAKQISRPKVEFRVAMDLEQAIKDGDIDLGVIIRPIPDAPADKFFNFELVYRENSPLGKVALQFVDERLQALNQQYIREQLQRLAGTAALPAETEQRAIEQSVKDRFSLTTLIPLVLILMTVTGAVYPSIDLTAGERERGTLEMLMAAPVPRLRLLIAKYFAVLTVALLTAAANLVAMTVTLAATGLGQYVFGRQGVAPLLIVQVFFLLVLFAAFFSAVLLAITSFARSFKEAQAYLIPLMLLALAPGVMSLMPGIHLSGILVVTPLINMVLLARDMFEGQATPVTATVVILSTALYAVAAIALAARIFGSDAVLYGSQTSWADMFRAPRRPRTVATVPDALFCLAMLFPLYFLTASALAQVGSWSLSTRLMMTGSATAAIFGGVPWLAARLQRLSISDCFNLKRPAMLAIPAAAILGFSVWPLAHELVLLNQGLGLTSISEEQLEQGKQLIKSFRDLSPWLILFSMAAAPAVFEELFFRGYLFSSLLSATTPRKTIVVSALLFGAFHVVVASALSPERFLPSTALGLLLGWVCWRTGSVLPGMLLHVCHNGVLLMMAYNQETLEKLGWGIQEQEHLPSTWLITAAFGLIAGTTLIWFGGKRRANLSRPTSLPPSTTSEPARKD